MATSILLRTKFLIPRLTSGLMPRPHLVDRILSKLDQQVIMLAAPPGYGKTTLMVEAAARANRPVAWYQLDVDDNDPTTYIAYLVEGLCGALPAIGAQVQRLLTDTGPLPPKQSLAILLNELTEHPDEKWLLVLDDYHFISNPAVHALTTTLVQNLLPGMSILLSTRGNPPLPLPRWRARGWLTELRAEHLRFSRDETVEWLNQKIPNLPEGVVETLAEQTEGWGAGLQLAFNLLAEPRESDAAALVARLDGVHPYVFHYLMDEVFARQPAHIREFLLRSSVLTQMNAEVCRSALGIDNARQVLEVLENENLFLVCLDDKREWYRYHLLFREFLLDRLTCQDEMLLHTLQTAAATYFEQRGEYEAAFQYLLLAGDKARAAEALRAFATDYLNQGRVEVLNRYFNQLGWSVLKEQPELLLVHGQALRYAGYPGEATKQLKQARTAAGTLQAVDVACLALTELAGIARSQGDYRQAHQYATAAVQLGHEARPATRAFSLMEMARCEGFLEGMMRGRVLAEQGISEMRQAGDAISPHQRAQLLRSLGQICWWHGDVRAAESYCQQALRTLSNDQSPLAAHILLTLATPCLYRCEYDVALRYAEQALAVCQRLQLNDLLPTAYTILGNVLTRGGQARQAEECLRQGISLTEELGAGGYTQVMAAGYLAYNLMTQGRNDEARQIAQAALWPHEGETLVYETYVCRSVLADSYLNDHQFSKAEAIFKELAEVGAARQYNIPLAMVYFGLAYIRLREGDTAQGRVLAEQSLALLEPTQAWELYADQGPRARVVCGELAQAHPDSPLISQVLERLTAKQSPVLSIGLSTAPRIHIQMLGTFRAFRGDVEIDPTAWVSVKARDMLAYFVTFRHERIPLDRVMEALWPFDERQSKNAFHTALYRLRQALRTGDETTRFILIETGDYRLDVARFAVDVDAFDSCLKQAQGAQPDDRLRWYQTAVELYRGEYLNNLYHDWVMPERQRLSDMYWNALRTLARLYAEAGNLEEAVALSRLAVDANPFSEEVHCDVMRYLHLLGDRQGVLQQYRALESALNNELGIEPLPSTKALFDRLAFGN